MANLPGQLEPIDLRYWPTRENALSWSSEGLAVATGEAVQILIPIDASGSRGLPQDSQWRKSMFSVNQFQDEEWSHVSLATIRHFSIGEELSDSIIISLAWSPPGLGLHRRNVLAILTSNLVLSFWEGDGKLDQWKRTAVVNQHLPINDDCDSTTDLAMQREERRIRAFCWIPPIKAGSSIKWGQHLLAVADDSDRISLFRVTKKERSKVGHWSFEVLGQHAIEPVTPESFNGGSLASVLSVSSRVSRIKASEIQEDNSANRKTFTFTLHLRRANGGFPKAVSVKFHVDPGNEPADSASHEMSLTSQDSGVQPEPDQDHGVTEADFEPALRRPRSDFDAAFSLSGKIRTRFYGISLSPDKSQAAACVSLHPTDMIEAVMPATQHTLIVFTKTNNSANVTGLEKTFLIVLEELLAFISSTDPNLIQSELDRKIIRSTISLILGDPTTFQKFTIWARLMSDRLPNGRHEDEMDLDKEIEDVVGSGRSWQEYCEVCSAPIPFSDPVSARCTHGHEFSRCNISLIAIQEPGISKYCAKCGRHFLDIANLNLPGGPSLTRALFEEFDVCPYCQGKFRG
ncbi:hypothetical protein H2204_007405 [Knufia peltigerae]|uniref:Transcription factor IIIC subunit delta N-term-domain-containing protein n=1 Tax=Knufia peltigerae TaxID=1002370 RepID=A0AA38Y1T2_9EURO|nr:hypothetical protein H2204_007405 [Knufia peltigerae]